MGRPRPRLVPVRNLEIGWIGSKGGLTESLGVREVRSLMGSER
jgi:hypothetical protein